MIQSKKIYHIKAFLYSTFARLKFSLGGQLGANEIMALINSLSIKGWKNLYHDIPDVKIINIAYITLLFSQIVSDIVNGSTSEDFIRGWANIVMAIVVTNYLSTLLWRSNKSIIYYLTGAAIGVVFFGAEVEDFSLEKMGFFKFTLVPILNSVLLIVSCYLLKVVTKKSFTIVFIFIAYGLFNIAFDSRSNGLIFLIVSFIIYKRKMVGDVKMKTVFPFLIGGLIVFQGLYSLYVYQVLQGNIGGKHSEEQFSMTSNPYNPINLLLAGRSEVYVAIIAVIDKPIFGHGSWAPDPGAKYTLLAYKLHGEEDKLDNRLDMSNGKLIIPSHSVIFGIWMTSGIVGFIAFMRIVLLFYKRGFNLLKSSSIQASSYYPIIVFFIVNSAWIFLFSPLPHIKQSLPIIIALIIVFHRKLELSNIQLPNKTNIN